MSDFESRIGENLASVRARMADAAARSGRTARDVRLVAVTKYVTSGQVRALAAAGCDLLGESRPQELWRKAADLADLPVRWHLVGHLQRNKAARTVPLVEMIESVDSLRLVEALDRAGAALGRSVPVLLEVNVSGETAKTGLRPEEVGPLLDQMPRFARVEVRGLMGMAALEGGPDEARRAFAALRGLRDRLRAAAPGCVSLGELSMGMSGDFEEAIEEGATIVRVGSALFEGIAP